MNKEMTVNGKSYTIINMLPIRILIIFQRILLYITKKYIMWISSAMLTWKNGILKTGV